MAACEPKRLFPIPAVAGLLKLDGCWAGTFSKKLKFEQGGETGPVLLVLNKLFPKLIGAVDG